MPSIGLNLRVTTDSKQGGRVYMEDVLRVGFEKGLDGKEVEFGYFAVFDGHGGVEAAQFAKEHLLNEIRKSKGFWSDDDDQVLKAIKLAFTNTHRMMWNAHMSWARTSSGYPSTSGTTSSVVIIRNQTLYVAHVGDSAVVLGTACEGGRLRADCLTDEHKPNAPKEMARIRESGGSVMAKAGVNRVVWQRPKKPQTGPIRRSTVVEKIPFLAVARSLGDLWSYNSAKDVFVVSPEPDVVALKLEPGLHKCLVIASDGLWNVIKPQSAVDLVYELEHRGEDYDGTKEKPASLLVKLALRRWESLFYRADNTSVIVVMIDPPGPTMPSGANKITRVPSTSTTSTLKMGSESDNDDSSESDVTGSDCDIDLDDGESDDLSLSYEVGKIFPRFNTGDDMSLDRFCKPHAARTPSTECLRCQTKPGQPLVGSANQPASPSRLARPCLHQVRVLSPHKSVCSSSSATGATKESSLQQQSTQTSHPPAPATSSVLMEAALNAPPFLESSVRVTSPQMLKSPQKLLSTSPSHVLMDVSSSTTDPSSPSRTLRPRSPRQAGGENVLVNGGNITPPPPRIHPNVLSRAASRYSMSPSSSFISNNNDPCSPLEATTVRSPVKVDNPAAKNAALPLATVSPLWPVSLDLGAEVEVGELLSVTRLGKRNTVGAAQDKAASSSAPSQNPTESTGGSATRNSTGGLENVEHPRRGRPTSRQGQGVKRRASSSPASLSARRLGSHQNLTGRKLRISQSSQPNTRTHLKSPVKKAKV